MFGSQNGRFLLPIAPGGRSNLGFRIPNRPISSSGDAGAGGAERSAAKEKVESEQKKAEEKRAQLAQAKRDQEDRDRKGCETLKVVSS